MKTNRVIVLSVVFLLFFGYNLLYAQISQPGTPLSFAFNVEMDGSLPNTSIVNMPPISNKSEISLIKNDPRLNNKNIYGKNIKCNYDVIALSGKCLFCDSIRIYTLKICSDSAVGMQFFFDDFYIPDGGKLFFYNENRTHVIGGFNSSNNRKNKKFGTRPIFGNIIVIEYYEPINAPIPAQLNIGRIVYIFDGEFLKPDNLAGDCNKSVACLAESGFNGWENEVKSVVMILAEYNGDYDHWGTGVLLNIAGGYSFFDQPFLLTAAHLTHDFEPYTEVENWVFLFGFEDTECGTVNSNTQHLTQNNSVFGAELLTWDDYEFHPNSIKSDFLLCKLMDNVNTINTNIDVSYAGWDRTIEQTSPGLCFHHPNISSKMFSYAELITTINLQWNGELCYD